MDKLDFTKLNNNNKSKNIKIGELSQEIIDTLHLNLKPQNIYLWENRVMEHCKKHEAEYSSPQAFVEAVECIPEILKNPDYVGIHKNGNIQFVKKYSDVSLVGVKIIKSDNSLLFRTIYPISESKLKNSIKNGKLYKM